MFCPANSKENQINMPVFRMLGSDAIYAYDSQAIDYGFRKCPTLEPVHLGGTKIWCDCFSKKRFLEMDCLCSIHRQDRRIASGGRGCKRGWNINLR